MTGFAWVLNLDADFELTRAGYTTSDKLRADLARNGASARALLGPDDVEIAPTTGKRAGAGYIGRAFCPTPRALRQLIAAGAQPEPAPPLAVLRLVNHRHFAHTLAMGLPHQRYAATRPALDAILAIDQEPWLLKRPLTFAGRGQLRPSHPPTPKENSWIDKSLRSDGLLVEPLVVPTCEVSLHGFIWRDGRHALGRICAQSVSPSGVYLRIALATDNTLEPHEREAFTAAATRVATALHAAGYFGPFGIDGYRYTGAWGDGFCALSEINARYTLGFAVGFPRPAHTLVL